MNIEKKRQFLETILVGEEINLYWKGEKNEPLFAGGTVIEVYIEGEEVWLATDEGMGFPILDDANIEILKRRWELKEVNHLWER